MGFVNRTEAISAEDGATFPGLLAVPGSGRGPGLLLLQEIFGVNDYVRLRAGQLAEHGYTVLAPDLYWRLEPGVALPHDEEGLQRAFGFLQRLDEPLAIRDAGAALTHLRRLPETGGRAGVIGFCMGGRIGYHVTARYSPDAAILYYGSDTARSLDLAPSCTCPILFHFGREDPYLPMTEVESIRAAFAGRDDVEFDVQPGAGHAFDNELAPSFHVPAAREAAWPITVDFLHRRLRQDRP